MNKPAHGIELLRLLDFARPKDYRCTVIKPDGSATDSPKFATSAEASAWARRHADPARDVIMTRRTNSCERN